MGPGGEAVRSHAEAARAPRGNVDKVLLCVCGGIAACIDMPMWSHMSGMRAHFYVRARVCLSIHHSCIVCVDCISVFVLCVCPPFLKREAMLCANMVDLCVIVAMSSIYTFLLLLGVCV